MDFHVGFLLFLNLINNYDLTSFLIITINIKNGRQGKHLLTKISARVKLLISTKKGTHRQQINWKVTQLKREKRK